VNKETELLRLEGISRDHPSPTPCSSGSARAVCPGLHQSGFKCLQTETSQPLWATCASV